MLPSPGLPTANFMTKGLSNKTLASDHPWPPQT